MTGSEGVGRRSNLVSAGLFVAVAIVFAAGSVRLGISSSTSDGVPGAGFFPFLMAMAVIVLGSAQIVLALRSPEGGKPAFALEPERRGNLLRLFATLAALPALFAIWKLAFFEIAALAFCLFLNRVYGRGWPFTLIFSFLMVGLVHLLFVRMLYIQFTF